MAGPTSNPDWKSTSSGQGSGNNNTNTNTNANRNENGSGNGDAVANGSNAQKDGRPFSPKQARRESSLRGGAQSGHIRYPPHLQRPHLTSQHRSISDVYRDVRSREEQETLLGDDELADPDGCLREDGTRPGPREIFTQDPHRGLKIYFTIQRIRRLILASIEDPYTMDQLREPRMNVLIVKPLVERLYDEDDVSVVYCLLVNRMQFLREQSFQQHHQTVNLTRANLCEVIASKILRRSDEENLGRPGLLILANILVAPFDPFQGAPAEVLPERHRTWHYQQKGGYEGKLTALEVAIITESKGFLSGSASQKVIDAIYRGRIVYTPTTFLDIIPDHYKHKPISLYDPRKAPLLNQYRLIVPRTRNVLEVVQFVILIGLYCLCMMKRTDSTFTWEEGCFLIYAAGWVMDEFISTLEHGWHVHTQNLWAFLDITFSVIYIAYLGIRIHAWVIGSADLGRQAIDVLAIAAPILFPRLAFNLMPENMLFISLRAMMKEFTALTLIAVWCFGGFLLALKWLAMGNTKVDFEDSPNPITISKWMLWIWFGLDGTGIQQAPRFHEFLGPTLMVIYAFLGNTLFLTVLVSILSNTFSKIASDATAEIQFRRAVLTFEGVKSDALFAYRPPLNLLAFFILLPLKFILTPRWFHKINITLVRVHNAPFLLFISWYERRSLWKPSRRQQTLGPSKKAKWNLWNLTGLSVHSDLQTVFENEPPQQIVDEIEEEDELDDAILENSFAGTRAGVGERRGSGGSEGGGGNVRRRLSSVWQSDTDV